MAGQNILFVVTCICILVVRGNSVPTEQHNIKGLFAFGSSMADNGNNNFVNVTAKVNFWPYGIDFPAGPTGRYSNGKNIIDVLCDELKLPLIPPFNDPSTVGPKIIGGVNFASGGSGVFEFTGADLGNVTNFNEQVKNFEGIILPKLEVELGKKSSEILPNYLFAMGIGGNDLKYFFGNKNKINESFDVFSDKIVQVVSDKIKKLYSLGARKFVVLSVYPIGCYPSLRFPNECNKEYNDGSVLYVSKLKSLVDSIQQELPGSHLALVNQYNIMMDIINNPISQGFQNVKDACFVAPKCFMEKRVCEKKDWNVCENRKAYVFFDIFGHQTEAVSVITGSKAFHSDLQSEVYPINLDQLSKIPATD